MMIRSVRALVVVVSLVMVFSFVALAQTATLNGTVTDQTARPARRHRRRAHGGHQHRARD